MFTLLEWRRRILENQSMIGKTMNDLRVAFDAVKVAADGLSQLMAVLSPPKVGGDTVSGLFGFRDRMMVRRIWSITDDEVRTGSFSGELGNRSFKTSGIDDLWDVAREHGIEHVILDELDKVDGFRALVSGTQGRIADWIKAAGEWVVAHREQLLAIAKIVISFLLLIGAL